LPGIQIIYLKKAIRAEVVEGEMSQGLAVVKTPETNT
jgi:hypothetical protein